MTHLNEPTLTQTYVFKVPFLTQSGDKIFPLFRTFVESFNSLCPEKPWVTKLSSAGLVYMHFGRQLLAQLTQLKEDDRQLEVLYDKVREETFRFIAGTGFVFYGIGQL